MACPHCGCNTLLGGGTKNGVFVEKNYVGLLAEDRCAQCGHLFEEKHKIHKKMTLKLMIGFLKNSVHSLREGQPEWGAGKWRV
jgi:uncharacterized Zn finger protein